jgi:hypothetical protein
LRCHNHPIGGDCNTKIAHAAKPVLRRPGILHLIYLIILTIREDQSNQVHKRHVFLPRKGLVMVWLHINIGIWDLGFGI